MMSLELLTYESGFQFTLTFEKYFKMDLESISIKEKIWGVVK